MSTSDREALRRRIRDRREGLDAARRHADAAAVAAHLRSLPSAVEAKHVAAYHAMGGELDPVPYLEYCLETGSTVYLPVLDPEKPRMLHFRSWRPGVPMSRNRLGIPEPTGTNGRNARELDLVLVPLVACDRRGNRLGMGGGFYDTTFAWRLGEEPGRPHLVGMAYDFQVVDRLDAMPWDVPLGYIATPSGIIECSGG